VISNICFATANQHKLTEVRGLLPGVAIAGLADIGCAEVIPEDFETLRENAEQKARFVFNSYGISCFADDSGLEVSSLNGAPGVHSAYYGGPERSHEKNTARLLQELKNSENRKARFVTVIALVLNGELYFFEGELRGIITETPTGSGGFGYDPVFIPEGETRTLAEMTMTEKNAISHRAIAVKKLTEFLRTVF
jgi:XTP/dITP diphosphohydrolase